MKQEIFSIYDTKADAYLPPFFTQNKHTALRSFSDAVNDLNTDLSKHAGDFVLFQVGSWDDQGGILTPLPANINLGVGIEFQQSTEIPTPTLQEVK